jgi:hypothetical protein
MPRSGGSAQVGGMKWMPDKASDRQNMHLSAGGRGHPEFPDSKAHFARFRAGGQFSPYSGKLLTHLHRAINNHESGEQGVNHGLKGDGQHCGAPALN